MPRFFHTILPAFALIGVGTPLFAQDTPADGWNSQCEATTCTITAVAIDTESGNSIATLFFATEQEQGSALGAVVPLGIAIEPGLRIIADDEEISLSVKTCYPGGCQAAVEMEIEDLERLAASQVLELRYFPFNTERPISVEFPTDGLADALAQVRSMAAEN